MSSLQYISDSTGQITGVFIPIDEWNKLKTKYQGIQEEEGHHLPEWQMQEVRQRLATYEQQPELALDFDTVMEEIESSL